MKGQFFIISTIIMISALILITHYLYDYGKVDLTQIEQMQELNYIEDIENNLIQTAKISCNPGYTDNNDVLDANLGLVVTELKDSFIEKGIVLSITDYGATCGGSGEWKVTMESSDFYIEKTVYINLI